MEKRSEGNHRKKIRLSKYDYSLPGAYFITICTDNKYVIMPNHLHIVAVIVSDENGNPKNVPTISRMVQQFKGAVAKKIGKAYGRNLLWST